MDGVSSNFLLHINSEIIKPDLQIAVYADDEMLQNRLKERNILTRFEKGNQSNSEIVYMKKGISELEDRNVCILQIDNTNNLVDNVEKIVYHIISNWRER